MILSALRRTDLRTRLRSSGVRVVVGPFRVRVRSSVPSIVESLETLYANHEVELDQEGAHFDVRVDPPGLLRRFVRSQVQFTFEGRGPFIPLPYAMASPMLEAGLNWCVGGFADQFLVIHSATLERHGRALLMPAPPGSGKSTLCAALVTRGWRLLSDEFALLDPASGLLIPVPRPVALKGRSIDLIRAWAPDAVFGTAVVNNENETVAYMRPPEASVRASDHQCPAGLIVIPRYADGAELAVTPMTRARAVLHLADNSFNYNLHGRIGFERLADIADAASAVMLRYSRLEEGVAAIEKLAEWRAV